MKAKISTRYIQKRTDLTKVIPLDTPIVVFVDPSSLCNFSCGFCPCGNAHKDKWRSGRNAQLMKMDIFKKVVDDIQCFPQRINTLRLYKDGEPLMNRHLPEMIKYAQSKKIAERIDFTTNGSLFNPEFALKLMEAGLTRIIISVEALSTEGYKNVSGINIDFEKFVRNISFLYKNKGDCIIFIKITDAGGVDEKRRFFDIFGDICDEIAIESISASWPNFDVSSIKSNFNSTIYGATDYHELLVCPFIFYSIAVNADGSVSACFSDWNHKLIAGNVSEQSLVDIWNGTYMNQLRISILEGKRKQIDVCSDCGQMIYCALDNIDNSREILLERLRSLISE